MKQDPSNLKLPKLRQIRIANMANPTSAPALAQMVLSTKRRRQDRRPAEHQLNRLNSSLCGRTNAKTALSKYMADTSLWMNRPPSSPSDNEDEFYFGEEYQAEACSASQTRLDLQTNNSKKENSSSESHKKAPASERSPDLSEYEFASDVSETSISVNNSSTAKGADAIVKKALSRQTETTDTPKLVKEGNVETDYEDEPEVIEKQDHAMVEEYEKTFAYARRLRALLNMKFRELNKSNIEANFLLVKAHGHPTQKIKDRWRKVDMGETYNEQVKRQKLIDDFRTNAMNRKDKDESTPHYPDYLRFSVRFRKDNSEKRWTDYLAFCQRKTGDRRNNAPVPTPNDKYALAYQDIWSYCIVVFVRPWANIREIVDPVFARLGLEHRADFTYTIGTFKNDKRAGNGKILGVPNVAEQLEMYTTASNLYKKNCTEIFVNDNRCEMFQIFPDHYNKNEPIKPAESKKEKAADAMDKDGKEKKGDKDSLFISSSPGDEGSAGSNDSLLLVSARSAQPTPSMAEEAPPEIRGGAFLRDEAAAFEESAAMSNNCRLSPSQQQKLPGGSG